MSRGPRRHKKRLSRDGLPVDPNDWTEADWKSLLRACQKSKREISARHRPLTPEEAQAAYDAAPEVPLSGERIQEIVDHATGRKKKGR